MYEKNICEKQKLKINDIEYNFKVFIHPKYKVKSVSNNYQASSNYDIAVLEISKYKSNGYLGLFNGSSKAKTPMQFYGYGMTSLKKKSTRNIAYYEELGRGRLYKGYIKRPSHKNGLIISPPSRFKLDANNNVLNAKNSQVLRSDSGGPLLIKNKIVGIVRNYQISDSVYVASDSTKNEIVGKVLNIQSTFTALNHKSTRFFLSKHK